MLSLGGIANAQKDANGVTGTYALSFVRGAGAEGCPNRHDLEREVSERLGRAPFEPAAPRSIEILTERTPEGYRSVVSVIDRDGKLIGRRVLLDETATCAPIFSATALAVALLIDPEAALSRDSHANEAVGRFEVDEPPAPPPVAPAQIVAPAQPPPRLDLTVAPSTPAVTASDTPVAIVGAEALVTVGLVPEVTPGVGIVTDGLLGKFWGFWLSAQYVAKGEVSRGGATLDVSLTTFGAGVGVSPVNTRSLRVVANAGLLVGPLHVAVREGQPLDSSDHFFSALDLGVRMQAGVIDGFFITVSASGVVPFVRHKLLINSLPVSEPIWQQPAAGGAAGLGAAWAFF